MGVSFNASIVQPGRLEQGQLEKFGLSGFELGFSINNFFRYICF